MEKKRRLGFVDLRLQQDWNNLHKDKFFLDSFAVALETPFKVGTTYLAIAHISAPKTVYNDKPYRFTIAFLEKYPYTPPLVQCNTPIYHPNVEEGTGMVKLPIFCEDWRPVLTLNSILLAIQLMLIEPNLDYLPNIPYNLECAQVYRQDKALFLERVQKIMQINIVIDSMSLPMDCQQFNPNQTKVITNKKKRELREEDKTVHQLRKKFAAMCEDGFGPVKCLNVEDVLEEKEGIRLKFSKHSTLAMKDIGTHSESNSNTKP